MLRSTGAPSLASRRFNAPSSASPPWRRLATTVGRATRVGAGPQRGNAGRVVPFRATGRDVADIHLLARRHADDTQRRARTLHERDVDGELAVLGQEFLGSVERIDQPVGRPRGPLGRAGQAAFLGHDRQLRRQTRQACREHLVRGKVGLGERRLIGLELGLEGPGVDAHDLRVRVADEGRQRFEQPRAVGGGLQAVEVGDGRHASP